MANSSLRTNIQPNDTGNIADRNRVHTEVNELSRATGLRDVTTYLLNGWTATYVRIERIRDRVHVYVKGLDGTAATGPRWMDFVDGVGPGFSPADATESPLLRTASGFDGRISISLSGGVSSPQGMSLGSATAREVSWRCVASWPSPLPGTAA